MSTIAAEIPGSPPWLPQLTGEGIPERGPSYERFRAARAATNPIWTKTRTVQWVQYWQRVEDLEVDCGLTAETSYEVRIGVTKTQGEELSAKLSAGISQLGLGAEIGSAITSQVTIERSETRELTLKDLVPNECQRLRVTIWQLIDEFVITSTWVGRLLPRRQVDVSRTRIPQRTTRTRAVRIDADECCEDQARRHDGMEPYRVSFPGGERLVHGAREEDGKVALDGVHGRYEVGDLVPLASFVGDESWLAVPEGPAFTYGLLSLADADPWEQAEDEDAFATDEQAVAEAFFEMPLEQVRALFDGNEEVMDYVSRVRRLRAQDLGSVEDLRATGLSEDALVSMAARVLAARAGEQVTAPGEALAQSAPLFIYAAPYGERSRALADYRRLLESQVAQLTEAYGVAVVSRDESGVVRVEEQGGFPGRAHSEGIAIEAALGALLPGSAQETEATPELADVIERIRSGISPSDAAELDELLDEGDAVLVAIGESAIGEPLQRSISSAEGLVEKKIEAESEGLMQALETVRALKEED